MPTRRSRLLLAALVLSHLVLISRQVDGGGGMSLIERIVFQTLAPIQSGISNAFRGVAEVWSSYFDLREAREESREQAVQIRELERELAELRHRAAEAGRLRALLGLREILPTETLAADVVARDGLPWFRSVTIDRGSTHDVRLNAAVISSLGVVGRVIGVGPRHAKVQLLLDRELGVGGLVERNGVTGILVGQVGLQESGTTDLVFDYVPALADVAVGDVVVTSGLDGIFPRGLTIGRVSRVGMRQGLFRDVTVTPSARFDRLDELLVVTTPVDQIHLTESVK